MKLTPEEEAFVNALDVDEVKGTISAADKQIALLTAPERDQLVLDLAQFIRENEHGYGREIASHIISASYKGLSVAAGSLATAQALFAHNPNLADAWAVAASGALYHGGKGLQFIANTRSEDLIYNAVKLAKEIDKAGGEIPTYYTKKYPSDHFFADEQHTKERELTVGIAQHLVKDEGAVRKNRLAHRYRTIVAGLSMTAAILTGGDLLYNNSDGIFGGKKPDSKEKDNHELVDYSLLALIGADSMRRSFRSKLGMGLTEEEKLLRDARKHNKRLEEEKSIEVPEEIDEPPVRDEASYAEYEKRRLAIEEMGIVPNEDALGFGDMAQHVPTKDIHGHDLPKTEINNIELTTGPVTAELKDGKQYIRS